jgi:hypothetical protein
MIVYSLPLLFLLFYLDLSDANLHRTASILRGAYDPSTLRKYSLGLHLWDEFQAFKQPASIPLPLSEVFMLGCSQISITLRVMEFLHWLTNDKGMLPHIAASHIVAVRAGFAMHLGDVTVFDNQVAIHLARKSLRAKSSREDLIAASAVEIQPLLLPQLDWLRDTLWVSPDATIDDKMIYVAIALCQDVILRIGETVSEGPYFYPNGEPKMTDHRFYLRELILEDEFGQTHQVDTYYDLSPRPTIMYFRLEHLSTKTSGRQAIRAKPYHFFRDGTDREVQFFNDFLDFLEMAGVRDLTKPLFSRIHPTTGTLYEARGKEYRQAIKSMAPHFGLDPSYYSGKSTRKGGSTSMHVSGRSDSDMLQLAGHAQIETTLSHYVKDVGHRGNTFRNEDGGQVTLDQLKRSLPLPSSSTSSSHVKISKARSEVCMV